MKKSLVDIPGEVVTKMVSHYTSSMFLSLPWGYASWKSFSWNLVVLAFCKFARPQFKSCYVVSRCFLIPIISLLLIASSPVIVWIQFADN